MILMILMGGVMDRKLVYEQLNSLYERAPVTSMQANRRADIKASRIPTDKHAKLSKIDNHINKILHNIKTKGNSEKAQRALKTAKISRFKLQRKLSEWSFTPLNARKEIQKKEDKDRKKWRAAKDSLTSDYKKNNNTAKWKSFKDNILKPKS
jgi:hypothetical protein